MSLQCIITALPAESRVFIDALKLKPILDQGWRLYGNSNCLLLQTGIGKLKAAAAVSAVLHTHPDISTIINAGIAGGDAPVGTVFLGGQICDVGSGASWYPHLPPQRIVDALPTATIHTVDQTSSDYQPGIVFDMEAAGIMSAATSYLSTDAIHFLKIVSDNPDNAFELLKPEDVVTLMKPVEPMVKHIMAWRSGMAGYQKIEVAIDEVHRHLVEAVHHTANDKHQLLRLIQQHYALTEKLPVPATLIALGKAKLIRDHLRKDMAGLAVAYGAQP